ncbi:MAG TPA: prolyl oligopeptidase family serine peptidase, partial [Acidimicrobiales bacterium]|nr:prolyl oligopeptidase family serine peptidase [Acidimicrobiales bacterium]
MAASEIEIVPTRRSDQADELHGELVGDPYRWLEDSNDPETRSFIEAQNKVTESWLAAIPAREEIRSRLGEIWDHPRAGLPFERGGRWFQFRNSGLQNQSVLYVMDRPEDEGHVLLDPNLLSEDGTVSVPALDVSDDGSLLAYATSGAGSDWMTWHVREVVRGEDRDDLVKWSKFGSASFLRDGSGFFYPLMEPAGEGEEYLARNEAPRIFLHRLGTPQADDVAVVDRSEHPEWLPGATVSEDGRYLVVSISVGTNPQQRIEVLDLDAPGYPLVELIPGFDARAFVVTNVGSTFYLVTDHGAERRRLVAVELERPSPEHWREVVPERGELLLGAMCSGGMLVCHHLQDARSRLSVVTLSGEAVRELPVPKIATVEGPDGGSGLVGRSRSSLLHFGVRSFLDAGSIWSHHMASGETRLVSASSVSLDPERFVSEQVFVEVEGGIPGRPVPLFLTRRRDVAAGAGGPGPGSAAGAGSGAGPGAARGDVPVLLYGYGGFDVPMTPRFRSDWAVFAERGGMVAVAVLPGGGEYGRSWHEAGRLAHKQRVFDSFAGCARWLASSGWSRPARIAINGGSNGGLLVGACLVQHPELYGAAVPEVGVLDMLRFHRFTIGWAWTSDFGSPEDPEQYRWLRAYSPLHNVRPGLEYPATLVMTGDHDDRVVPGH